MTKEDLLVTKDSIFSLLKTAGASQPARYAIVAIIAVCLSFFIYFKFIADPTPPLINAGDTSPSSMQSASTQAGHALGSGEAGQISNEINDRLEEGKPDATATFTGEDAQQQANNYAQQTGKADGADVVISTPPTSSPYTFTSTLGNNVTANYYGIHYEKKTAIGVYADVDKDGSIGLSVRHDRAEIDVGKKYKSGSITARVSYEVLRF